MTLVGVVLNVYLVFENTDHINISVFNSELLKSSVVATVVLIILIVMNKDKYR